MFGAPGSGSVKSESAFNLLSMMLEYDPAKRITAEEALNHPYFNEDPKPAMKFVFFLFYLERLEQEDKRRNNVECIENWVCESLFKIN